jgi:hypothetical protein
VSPEDRAALERWTARRKTAQPGSTVWITDWSDEEDGDARAAGSEAGLAVDVVRVSPLGRSVGTRLHRLRSYPSYAWLAEVGTCLLA